MRKLEATGCWRIRDCGAFNARGEGHYLSNWQIPSFTKNSVAALAWISDSRKLRSGNGFA